MSRDRIVIKFASTWPAPFFPFNVGIDVRFTWVSATGTHATFSGALNFVLLPVWQ